MVMIETILTIVASVVLTVVFIDLRGWLAQGKFNVYQDNMRAFHITRFKILKPITVMIRAEDNWFGPQNEEWNHGKNPCTINHALKKEICDWIKQNCKGTVLLNPFIRSNIHFTNKNDLVLFKIRWCGSK